MDDNFEERGRRLWSQIQDHVYAVLSVQGRPISDAGVDRAAGFPSSPHGPFYATPILESLVKSGQVKRVVISKGLRYAVNPKPALAATTPRPDRQRNRKTRTFLNENFLAWRNLTLLQCETYARKHCSAFFADGGALSTIVAWMKEIRLEQRGNHAAFDLRPPQHTTPARRHASTANKAGPRRTNTIDRLPASVRVRLKQAARDFNEA